MNANPNDLTRGQIILNVVCFAIVVIPAWLIWKWFVWAAHAGPYGPEFYDVDFEQAPPVPGTCQRPD